MAKKTPPAKVEAKRPPGSANIPLRLRRRRDGTLALTDRFGRIDGPEREFPSEHLFLYDWLARNSTVARLDGDLVRVELVNARAAYRVVEHGPRWRPHDEEGDEVELPGVLCRLDQVELSDPPPIDEERAAQIAQEIAERQRAEALAAARALIAEQGKEG